MFYSTGFSVELWFYLIMQKYRLLDYTPIDLGTVIRVVRQYMPSKAATGEAFLENPENVEEWLDRILKIDSILCVEQADGTLQRVAVDVSANASKAQSKFNEIRQSSFRASRRELKIDRHWIILVDSKNLPAEGKVVDAVYEAVDEPEKCVMIDLIKP